MHRFLVLLAAVWLMATGDILAVRIASATAHKGWVAEVDLDNLSTGGTYAFGLGSNNDPSSAKLVFTVTSPGFDSTGAVTTIQRTVYGVKQVRKPYPNQTTADEGTSGSTLTVRVALSEFIYSSDTVTAIFASGFYTQGTAASTFSGSVTNNSTLAYPKCIGHFALENRRPVNGTTAVEVFAVQKFGKNGKPVAAVKITATGGSSGHVETSTVTAMTLSARADVIPVYAASLNLSSGAGFTRGEVVSINFTAYPWVGDSSAILDATADAGANIYLLGPLSWTIMDKMIAVVDAAGNDTTGVASTSQATADANPCLTISGALTKIAAQNNSSFSLNRCDGGEVQCKAGTYKTGKYSTQAVTNGYFTIAPHSSTNRAGVIFDGFVTSQNQYAYQRYYNVTFTRATNVFLVFGANPNVLVMEKVNLSDSSTTGWYAGDTNTSVEFLDCLTGNTKLSPGGNDGHSRLNRNCTWTAPTGGFQIFGNCSCVLGAHGTGSTSNMWNALAATETNIIIAHTTWTSKTDGSFVENGTKDVAGLALVNNLVEQIGVSATPLGEIDFNASNILLWHNPFTGQRFNHENNTSGPPNKTMTNWGVKYNCFNARGDHRADVVGTDGTMTGTWTVGYSVGFDGNRDEAIAANGDQDFWGIYSNRPAGTSFTAPEPIGYVSDKSQGGTNVGGGDYHLGGSATALNIVLSSRAVTQFDLEGTYRTNLGNGSAGAYEMNPPPPGSSSVSPSVSPSASVSPSVSVSPSQSPSSSVSHSPSRSPSASASASISPSASTSPSSSPSASASSSTSPSMSPSASTSSSLSPSPSRSVSPSVSRSPSPSPALLDATPDVTVIC